jgi:sterol desaturase/sphingolipid hydroxylase (fatty acid hydroxylase superfamily)
MNEFALPLAVMLVLVVADLLALKHLRGEPAPWRDMVLNLDSGHILMWFFRGVEVAGFGWVHEHASLHWVDQWSTAAVWGFTFVAWDFCFYWLHRLHHKLPLMWAVHAVHHEGEHFNLSLGVRNSWYSSLTSFPFFAGLAVLGVPLDLFVVVSGIHYSVQFYNHCGTVRRSGVLEKFVITPAHHRIHHGANPEYVDKNFGGTLLVWDRLFGTFQPELRGVAIRYGVPGAVASANPFWANMLPVLRYLRLPLPRLQSRDGIPTPAGWVGAGGVALFCMVIYYVHRQGTWPGAQQAILFALILLATIALGGFSEGRPWGLPAWAAVTIGSALLFLLVLGMTDSLGRALLLLLSLHGAASLVVGARTIKKIDDCR